MQSHLKSQASLQRIEDWRHLEGRLVELRYRGIPQRLGRVDTVMPDTSGLWLAAHAPDRRMYVDHASGYEIWAASTEDTRPNARP